MSKSIKELRACAQELIDVMDLQDEGKKIVLAPKMSEEELTTFIVDAGKWYNPDVDDLSEETLAIVAELSQDNSQEQEEESVETEKEETKENSSVSMDDIQKEVEEAEKIGELRDIIKVYDEFKTLRPKLSAYKSFADLREAMLDIILKPAKKEKPKAEKAKEEKPIEKVKEEKSVEKVKEPKEKAIAKKEVVPVKENVETETKEKFLKINPLFKEACPELSKDELHGLEALILKDGVILEPLILWKDHGDLVDGHNRYEIALKHKLPYTTIEKEFADEKEVIVWIKENAISQRNLPEFARYELIKDIEKLLQVEAKEKQSKKGAAPKKEKVNVRDEVAKKAGMSSRQVAKAKVVDKEADEDTKKELRAGKKTIGKAYEEVKEKKQPAKGKTKDPELILRNAARELQLWLNKYGNDVNIVDLTEPIEGVIVDINEMLKDKTYK